MNGKSLRSGHTRSCGCIGPERLTRANTTHGKARTKAYKSYLGAKARCINPNEPAFHNYGGRGIEFRFKSFEEFYAELGDPPPGMTVGRINNGGHYEPGNVKWDSRLAQNNNTRRNRPVTAFGVTHNLKVWSRMTGVPVGTLLSRLKKLPPEEALAHIRIPSGTFWVMETVPSTETYSMADSWRWKPYEARSAGLSFIA